MDEPAYSYATHLNIKFDPLKLIDVSSLARDVTDKWHNQTLCKVNGSVVRLGVMQGEYHWHKHYNDDEFFFVLSGKFIVDLEGRSVELLPNQGFVVPKGVMHCTRAPEKSTILMVETAAIVPPGDAWAGRTRRTSQSVACWIREPSVPLCCTCSRPVMARKRCALMSAIA